MKKWIPKYIDTKVSPVAVLPMATPFEQGKPKDIKQLREWKGKKSGKV